MVKIEWPDEVVNIAFETFLNSPRDTLFESMRAALTAALAKMQEMGLAEHCRNFVWSDWEDHKFGNGEDDMCPVIILKIGASE